MLSSKTIKREYCDGGLPRTTFTEKVCRQNSALISSKLSSSFDRVKCESGAGYTIIEILAAIMIFTMMMGVTIISFRGVTDKDRLKSEIVRVAGIVREARARAFNGVIPPGVNAVYPKGGYGVYMNKNTRQIVLFADKDGDNYYDIDIDIDIDETILSSLLSSKLSFNFIRKTPFIIEEIIKFNGDDYPKVFDVSTCPPPGDACPNTLIAIPTIPQNSSTRNGLFQILLASSATPPINFSTICFGQITVSDKTTTIEPLLIDTVLKNC